MADPGYCKKGEGHHSERKSEKMKQKKTRKKNTKDKKGESSLPEMVGHVYSGSCVPNVCQEGGGGCRWPYPHKFDFGYLSDKETDRLWDVIGI